MAQAAEERFDKVAETVRRKFAEIIQGRFTDQVDKGLDQGRADTRPRAQQPADRPRTNTRPQVDTGANRRADRAANRPRADRGGDRNRADVAPERRGQPGG
ncbi:hypothetical protein AWW66_25340 [Micromonospora rosaria]|uniref:Uncharacterized protein n=1 Tax=Micromonospora rosaria TaxID=47874 RepID=A0A136PLG4_9ACTN|nr:hypothetical protein [Micromonospora rosaria]KXK59234.1 hypothetical protein AWW66_25340 [Micromonospora rosaria]